MALSPLRVSGKMDDRANIPEMTTSTRAKLTMQIDQSLVRLIDQSKEFHGHIQLIALCVMSNFAHAHATHTREI